MIVKNQIVYNFIKFFVLLLAMSTVFSQDIPYFSGAKAIEYLEKQCEFGPRFPGSEGHSKTAEYFQKFLNPLVDELIVMNETTLHPIKNDTVRLTNIFARFNPSMENRILLMAHWDTREIADKDLIIENRIKPIIGANDGASGIAVLMTIAEILDENPLENIGVDLLFVDGEDMGEAGDPSGFGIGTKLFSKKIPRPYPQYAVCLDMVGDTELEIPIEWNSYQQAPDVVTKIWAIATSLGFIEFKYLFGSAVTDDHKVLFDNTGIPAVDIIDFQYPNADINYWHTLQDIPENCSARSLGIVGSVIIELIYQEELQK
ncbi:MAG: M28 family peptidase [Candidatus Marinimicrobia bacterium]|nr:M28 family peptidase [Candidatus Neomarinimicrobiota bacterium]MBL7023563.1 M28 family peptidase [Candidatus Neomarinimicrobiota bacterium]MBL7109856.1 M28 family peptidase [Candidatus Neomarinimicrobiota bacterium]